MEVRTRSNWLASGRWKQAGLLVLGIALLFPTAGRATTGEVETREFIVHVDGKRSGQYRMTIEKHPDGSVSMSGSADIKVTKLGIVVYRYSFRGGEVWKDGRLYALQSTTDDDGKRFTVNAVALPDALKITVNGNERTTRADVWLTTYWHTPNPAFHNQVTPLVDADTGENLNATLIYVGQVEMTVAGRRQACSHYRLRGDRTAELWYDGQGRLVREKSFEDGHDYLLELAAVR
jgi:hypothetical protein